MKPTILALDLEGTLISNASCGPVCDLLSCQDQLLAVEHRRRVLGSPDVHLCTRFTGTDQGSVWHIKDEPPSKASSDGVSRWTTRRILLGADRDSI